MIELGGGTRPHPRANIVIDLHHPRFSEAQDATVLPWMSKPYIGIAVGGPDSFRIGNDDVDEVYASHFMEHIPHGQPLINVMNEAWRVLKPGGTFTMVGPLVGYTDPWNGMPLSNQIGWQPWADPTHLSFWWFPEALYYFCEGAFRPNADYGISLWAGLGGYVDPATADAALEGKIIQPSFWSVRDGWEGIARLQKGPA